MKCSVNQTGRGEMPVAIREVEVNETLSQDFRGEVVDGSWFVYRLSLLASVFDRHGELIRGTNDLISCFGEIVTRRRDLNKSIR
jgi:hypothetical protein